MKVIAICGSPRKNGNTATILNKALEGAKADGAEVELFSVAGKNIQFCDGCLSCHKTGRCHIKDDVAELFDKVATADGLILGTPIYCWGMAAQLKAIIDRSAGYPVPDSIPCGVVCTAMSMGLLDTAKDLYYFIKEKKMLPANTVAAYSTGPDQTVQYENCMKESYNLGRQIVALAKSGFKYPEEHFRPPFGFGTFIK